MQRGSRDELLRDVAGTIGSITLGHPVRVGIDGPPAAGKTTLADELAVVLRDEGCDVIRATIEGFLFPRAQRHRRGEYSPEGCYFDNHDYEALNRVLLDPLGPDGDGRFQHAIYDKPADEALSRPIVTAAADAVLLFDGVFLMRPEIVDRWDLTIFISTEFERTLDRALIRERDALPTADIERRWRERYIPSQEIYFAAERPTDRADIVIYNDDLHQPEWEVRL